MKLSGPSGLGVRLIIGRPTRGIVSGIFPPEDAAPIRAALEASLADHQPRIGAALEADERQREHDFIHGTGTGEPIGILNAKVDVVPMHPVARVVPQLERHAPVERSPIWTGRRRSA